ncbi:MAG: hypothetical protein JNK19_13260 [Tabrizicola sp.]|nr:hypothetical protein [Tabrizicola sp.]
MIMGAAAGFLSVHRLFLLLLALRYAVPLLLTGSIAVSSHDNLDSEVVYSVVAGRFWAMGLDPAAFEVFLAGQLDWTYFARSLQPLSLIYAVLPPELAYVVTDVLLLTLAYGGMRTLLARLDLGGGSTSLLACMAAFGLSYSSLGAGLAGAPLVLALIMGKEQRASLTALIVAGFVGLNSVLVLHGLFLPVAALGLTALSGQWPPLRRAISLCGAFLAGALASASGLIMTVLSGVPSHRTDWSVDAGDGPLIEFAESAISNLLTMGGAYHAVVTPAVHVPVILIAATLVGGLSRRAALVLVLYVLAGAALKAAEPVLSSILPDAFATVQWNRILFFAPLLALVVAAMLLQRGKGRAARVTRGALWLALVLASLAGMGINPAVIKGAVPQTAVEEVRASLRSGDRMDALAKAGQAIAALRPAGLRASIETWSAQARPEDYACLRGAMGSSGRVLSFGPDPMMAPLNGIAAIDGYHNFYPLSYKQAFRPVIAAKLAADPDLAAYYDGWGSRVSAFADRAPEVLPDFAAAHRLGATHVIADRAVQDPALTEIASCAGLVLYRIATE